jgi:aquaporin Z
VNPARSTGPALFAGGDHIVQLWLFWLAPIAGGVIGALLFRAVLGDRADDLDAQISGDPEQAIG